MRKQAKYRLAKGKKQDAFILGYRPKSEKLVAMSPDKFLSLAGKLVAQDNAAVEILKQKMSGGKHLDALWLDVDINKNKVQRHEGRHRALAAKELGIKKVPVILYARDGYEWADKFALPGPRSIRRQRQF